MKKTCNDCGQEKDSEEDFYKTKRKKADGSVATYTMPYCKVCWGLRAKTHRDNMTPEQRKQYDSRHRTPEAYRRRNLMRQYGITPEQFDAMLADQGGVCAICGNAPGERAFHVDHDHACCAGRRSCGECLRGLLCTHCNSLLAYARDNTKYLHKAIEYLETNS
ncbi:endonuclease VII domain-containing protein [Streptomyces sp. NPDC091879]|jgi:hypothetical protein|uniref:endonuclease VII domain-containing protein n=1 Tax=Streptomyces sp. NPDC091879 TaxID=3366006 RepID=UPI00382675A4